jgi:ankyrin repeat protein
LAKRILDEGANPDVYNARYGTPLHRAAAAGHSAVVAQLLASGAVVDPRDQQGLTPLYHAVRFGKRPTAGLLLNRGANANIADRSRRRPLHWAAQSNQRGLIEPLLSAGANLEAVDTRGNTALHLAARRGYREFASQLLAAGAAINARTPDLLVTPLHLAVQQGDLGMVQELLNAGAYTNAMSQLYGTPLHWIALSRETDPKTASDIVATLLAAGANPELTDVHDYTPAQRAQQVGHNSLAKSLAATGTDKKSYGQLPALASKDCQMPDQMHRASRVVLDNYLNGELGKAEYRRRFSLPNSDYVALAECLSTQ